MAIPKRPRSKLRLVAEQITRDFVALTRDHQTLARTEYDNLPLTAHKRITDDAPTDTPHGSDRLATLPHQGPNGLAKLTAGIAIITATFAMLSRMPDNTARSIVDSAHRRINQRSISSSLVMRSPLRPLVPSMNHSRTQRN
jgi:hypothetical protein